MARKSNGGIGRRRMLKGAAGIAGAAVGSGAVTGFLVIWARNNKNIVLRQCGTGVSAINEIAEKCKIPDPGILARLLLRERLGRPSFPRKRESSAFRHLHSPPGFPLLRERRKLNGPFPFPFHCSCLACSFRHRHQQPSPALQLCSSLL